MIAKFPNLVFDAVIRESVKLAEAPSFGLPISSYAPKSNGAADYKALAAEIIADR
jgi:chromosome partitioning protein